MVSYLLDARRQLEVAPTQEALIQFAATHFLETAQKAQADHGFFSVALSGGSTPKAIYKKLLSHPLRSRVDWERVLLFWSDERAVPPTHPESNFHMALVEGELNQLNIPQNHIFRMEAERDLEEGALRYEKILEKQLGDRGLDLTLLGVGEEGHTASLFPHTAALEARGRKVVANFVPTKKSWRMTFTLEWINASHRICFYVMGGSKAAIIETLFRAPLDPALYPAQGVGSPQHPALWLLDAAACEKLLPHLK